MSESELERSRRINARPNPDKEIIKQQADEIKKLKEWNSFPKDSDYFEVYNPWNMEQVLRFSKSFIEEYVNDRRETKEND